MKKLLTAGALGALAFLSAGGVAHAQDANASVVIIHGVPNTPVDVYVNGALTLDDFAPDTVTDPQSLPAGTYDIEVRAADAAETDPALFGGSATVEAGGSYTVVAHLDAAGAPTLTPFVNDFAATPAGQGCIVVRHTAAAPAVDVYAGDAKVVSSLENPDSAGPLVVPVGTVSASVTAAGAADPVIGPADLPVTEGTCTIVYAVGSLDAQTLKPVVQTLSVGVADAETTPTTVAPAATPTPTPTATTAAPVPTRIESGDSGLAASATGPNGAILVAAGGLALMVGTSGALALVRVRREG